MMRLVVTAALLVVLQACASGPSPVSPEAPAASRGSSAGATPAVTTPDNGSGAIARPGPVDGLLAQARDYRAQGDLDASFARLDRALRIAPQRAEVYLEFARSHQAAGNAEQAAASAQRGLLYCEGRTCRDLRELLSP